MRLVTAACSALVAALVPTPSSAQGTFTSPPDTRALLMPPTLAAPQEAQSMSLAPTFLSLALPGVGQHVLGQNRKWVYAAAEVVGWAVFLERRAAGSDARTRYRDYAWEYGRVQMDTRVEGDFEYYETMSKWTTSGAFDADAGMTGVQPETDPAAYNGYIWQLAVQMHIPGGGPVPVADPAYQSALAYYQQRAYGTAFLWDWSSVPGGREELGTLIEAADDRFREATTAVGFVIANHVISAADAYLSSRGRSLPARIRLMPSGLAYGPAWRAVVSVSLGR
jgi:hypothetical protein